MPRVSVNWNDSNSRLFRLYVFAFLIGLFSACQIGGDLEQGTIHPTPENIPEATHPDLTIDLTDPSAWEIKPPLVDTTLFSTIDYGGEDGPFEQLLSVAQDLARGGDSTLLILDADPRRDAASGAATVHVVSTDGTLMSKFGSRGEGPGEFLYPNRLLIRDAGNQVYVLGRELHMEVYNRQSRSQYEFARQVQVPFTVADACIMNDFMYALKYDASTAAVIQKLSLDGEVVASFGTPYQSENPFVVEMLSGSGDIVCNETHDLLGFAPHNIPAFKVFTSTGQLLWRLTIRGLKPLLEYEYDVDEEFGPNMIFRQADPEESGHGEISPGLAFGNGDFYLDVNIRTGIDESRSLIFQVNSETGSWTHVADGFLATIVEDNLMAFRSSDHGVRIMTR